MEAGTIGNVTAGPSDEAGRKWVTQEITASTSAGSVTESPTSRPPPDKQRANGTQPTLKSVVIPRPQFRVGHRGIAAPQMSIEELIEWFGDPEASSDTSSVPSGTVTAATAGTPNQPIEVEEPRQPAFLPPSENVSGSVVINDSKHIWEAAEFFHAHMYAVKRRAPPTTLTNAPSNNIVLPHKLLVRYVLTAPICRSKSGSNAPLSIFPGTPHNYLAALQHNLSEQFPARYSLREGATWEANARYARHLTSLKPLLKSALQPARFCLMVDSTCRSDLPIDNILPGVMVMTMPLARIPEMAEKVVAIFDPNLTGSLKEPPPQHVIIANILDYMACEGLLMDLDAVMNDTRNPERDEGLLQ